jgi:hypothetical protein
MTSTPEHASPEKELERRTLEEAEPIEILTDLTIAKKMLQLKQSADSRGIEFNLSFKVVKRLLSTKKCYYTGKLFSTGTSARSIDRVETTKGYVNGNVVACTVEINSKKANLGTEEIIMLGKKIQQHQKRSK